MRQGCLATISQTVAQWVGQLVIMCSNQSVLKRTYVRAGVNADGHALHIQPAAWIGTKQNLQLPQSCNSLTFSAWKAT